MTTRSLASLLAAVAGLLIPDPSFAQQEQRAREVRIDEGISVQVAPIWQSRPLAGATKLELAVIDGSVLRMAVYFTVEKRRSASDALQRAAEIVEEESGSMLKSWCAGKTGEA